jgi:hypothetical protein
MGNPTAATRGARPHLIITVTGQTLFDGKGLGLTATGWDIEMAADGRPHLPPPPWYDPDRAP